MNSTTDERTDGVTGEPPPIVNVVQVTPVLDGPLHVKGNLELVSSSGDTIDRVTEVWFCRCGGSAKKPYCDGTHKRNGFKAEGRAPVRK